MTNHINFIVAFTSLSVVRVGCLRDVVVSVPHAVRDGDTAVLNCSFQLDGDALYTVKWYKGGEEFFRYTPKETPQVKVFPATGIESENIDKLTSDMTTVRMKKVKEEMAGRYMCEVSADAPSFHTAFDYGIMTIVQVPESSPTLSGLQTRYKPGEKLTARCTSHPSKPAANITWVLNDNLVDKSHTDLYESEVYTPRGFLQSSISQIIVHLKPSHFSMGRLKLKCIASIYNVYWETTEKSSELIGHNKHRSDHTNQVYIPEQRVVTESQDEGYRKPIAYNKPAEQGFSRNVAASMSFSWKTPVAILSLAYLQMLLLF